jgi:hypothetical protein
MAYPNWGHPLRPDRFALLGPVGPGGETEGSLRRQLSLPPVGRVRKVRNPDLDALADGAPFHNRRTVEHLMMGPR